MAKVKTKVMHVIRDLRCGGVERLFLQIIDGLEERGGTENVGYVMSDRLDFLVPVKARIVAIGLPLKGSLLSMVLMSPFEFFALTGAILKENPDVIFIHNTSVEQLLASTIGRALGKKTVVLKCEESGDCHALRRFIDPIKYLLCNRIVVISDATENELLSMGVPPSKLWHIRNGIRIDPQMLTRKEARLSLGLGPADIILGMVSRPHPVKNHAGVIRAMPKIVAFRKNAKLVIVGGGSEDGYKQTLEQLAHESGLGGSVVFLGERKDVERIYPAFDIFVHPSFSEGGYPLAVLEAASAGLPMVLGNVGGMKDLPEGCAMMIEPTDDSALIRSLKKLINDPELRQEYGKRARAALQGELSFDKMLEGYENLFRRL